VTPLQEEVSKFWNIILLQSEGGDLTLGKVISALVLAILGYIISRRLSARLSSGVGTKLRLPQSTTSTINTLSFYFVYTIIIIFVFQLLEVPLTIFTVLGSALAIGVGFGSQNIVKNFLSGITVLIEQPIKVGDFLEVDNLYGVVESVGFRSTRIKTGENTHVIIPNSSFLENKVLNWTLSDDIIRGKIAVGVAYGSDLEKVKTVLMGLDSLDKNILSHPRPYVIFAEFGSSTLDFEYFFFTKASTRTQLRQTESEIRFLVDKRFREENIVIAFPQLDLHIQK
jgi:potassium-dependent mechanosensitive channel